MINFLYVVNICGIVLLILTVLLQRASSGVLGGGSSSNVQSLLAKRGAAGLLTKMVGFFAVVYFLSALALSFLYSRHFDDFNVLVDNAIDDLLEVNLEKRTVKDSKDDTNTDNVLQEETQQDTPDQTNQDLV